MFVVEMWMPGFVFSPICLFSLFSLVSVPGSTTVNGGMLICLQQPPPPLHTLTHHSHIRSLRCNPKCKCCNYGWKHRRISCDKTRPRPSPLSKTSWPLLLGRTRRANRNLRAWSPARRSLRKTCTSPRGMSTRSSVRGTGSRQSVTSKRPDSMRWIVRKSRAKETSTNYKRHFPWPRASSQFSGKCAQRAIASR